MPTRKTTLLWALVGPIYLVVLAVLVLLDPSYAPLVEGMFFSGAWRIFLSIGFFSLLFFVAAILTGLIPWTYFALKWLLRPALRR